MGIYCLFFRKLHRATVQRTVLADDRAAVDADEFASGERLAYDSCGLGVVVGLGVSRVDYGPVDDYEISVCGR